MLNTLVGLVIIALFTTSLYGLAWVGVNYPWAIVALIVLPFAYSIGQDVLS